MISAVIFDMDGVIVNSEPLYQRAESRLFREYGAVIPDEDWQFFRGCTEERFYDLAIDRYGVKEDRAELMRKGRHYVLQAFRADLGFTDGFLDLMEWLRPLYLAGLVTSTPKAIFTEMDRLLNIATHFDGIITGEMTTNSKPHPEPYMAMMHQLQSLPHETVIIEDSLHGLDSALASGARTVALSGSVPVENMPAVHQLIHSLNEVTPDLLQQLATVAP